MSSTKRQLSLGLSIANLGYHYAAWRHPGVPADGNMDFRHFVHCAKLAERGLFDLIFLADSSAVRDLDRPAIARDMEHQIVKHEPTALLAALAAVTRHVGLVPTASATYNEPYNLTRTLCTLDHISGGRAGWNMVTGFSIDEARNFGLDKLHDSDTRHARAAEFAAVLRGLEDGGTLDHAGPHFRLRGSLDMAPGPQRRIPIFTAGTSDNAEELAARSADVVYGGQPTIETARAYYASVKGRLAKYGRSPDELKMMPGIMAFIGRTKQEAQDKFDRMQELIEPRLGLGLLTVSSFPDYTGYDLDGPVPELPMPGGRKSEFIDIALDKVRRENLSIRQLYELVSGGFWHLGVVGTPTMVADVMEEWFTTGAADGFNIQPPCIPVDAEDFVELVVPELQRRGLFRTRYEGNTLSDHLGLHQTQQRAMPLPMPAAGA
ncbi:alkanesulfonate monooxygenase [Humitalea rosea]|uniref:Alkanesulfonate monooxygenase n=1 Tax=Humitalea rosea TaxID=990373 RepID=A0A2W7HUL4_9PROT|nr:LLM class flavin-dependent oxidoreductase [Humitalea rosea]PZW37690.1 alkanesulfonate monooxygenase [Humitalea rosea]